jgi:hypothetical protein
LKNNGSTLLFGCWFDVYYQGLFAGQWTLHIDGEFSDVKKKVESGTHARPESLA